MTPHTPNPVVSIINAAYAKHGPETKRPVHTRFIPGYDDGPQARQQRFALAVSKEAEAYFTADAILRVHQQQSELPYNKMNTTQVHILHHIVLAFEDDALDIAEGYAVELLDTCATSAARLTADAFKLNIGIGMLHAEAEKLESLDAAEETEEAAFENEGRVEGFEGLEAKSEDFLSAYARLASRIDAQLEITGAFDTADGTTLECVELYPTV